MQRSYLWPYIEKMALRILNLADERGGYPATKEGDMTGTWVTPSLAASVMSAIGPHKEHESRHRLTVGWLHENDEFDGLFPMVRGTFPAVDPSAAAFEFLSRVQLGYGLEADDIAYAERIGNRILDSQKGGWGFTFGGTPLSFSTYWVIRALTVGKEAFPSLRQRAEDAFKEARDWLMLTKNESGWCNQSGKTQNVYTAVALLSLKLTGGIDQASYDEYCQLIADKERLATPWDDGIERHKQLTVIRFALPWCVAALAGTSYPEQRRLVDFWVAEMLRRIIENKVFYGDTEINTWPSRDVVVSLSEVARSPYSESLPEAITARYTIPQEEIRELSPERLTASIAYVLKSTKKNVKRKFRILFLSDPHFGSYQKKRQELLEAKNIVNDLKEINKHRIDALIVSGDITSNIRGQEHAVRHEVEFEEALLFLKRLIDELKVPPGNVIVVPGNHDVDWEEPPFYVGDVHKSDVNYRNFYTNLYLRQPNNYLSMHAYDRAANVGIMGLNSCLMCREKDKTWVGYVGDDQFNCSLGDLVAKGCSAGSFRIAVLHHHLLPVAYVSRVPVDDKHLSMTLDAEGILKKLIQNGFDLVLHGHQHQPFCAIERRIYRADRFTGGRTGTKGNDSIAVIGAGSIGAPVEELGLVRRNLYNIVEISQDRIQVWIRESSPEEPRAFSYYDEYQVVSRYWDAMKEYRAESAQKK